MYNIHLIFTRHFEDGNCNSYELYKIIESIQPDIIFEELSCANFHKSYQEGKLFTLETNAIKMYLLGHSTDHVPVDTFELPKSYEDNLNRMLDRITSDIRLAESRNLRNLINQLIAYANQHGFSFLNSKYNDEVMEKYNILKEAILNQLNEDRLFQIHKLEKETIENREEEMLRNIYQYSREHHYHQGLFFIGAGHRKSMLQKIKKYNEMEELKLNWIFND